jgi:hypothetical protein
MASKQDFEADEWAQLQRGLAGTVLLVSVSDPGFFDTFKEAGAAGKYYGDARRNNASELVRELSADSGTSFGLAKHPQQLEAETLSALSAAAATLKKAPDEIDAYRQFVVEVAQSVAGGQGHERREREIEKIEARSHNGRSAFARASVAAASGTCAAASPVRFGQPTG